MLPGISTQQLAHSIDSWVFSDKYRRILKSKLIDGLTYQQIAEAEDMSINGVKAGVKRWRL